MRPILKELQMPGSQMKVVYVKLASKETPIQLGLPLPSDTADLR